MNSNKNKAMDSLFTGLAQDLAPKRNISLLEKAKADDFFFAREIMGNQAVFPVTLEEKDAGDWTRLFKTMYSFAAKKGPKFCLVNSPRNSFKTTLLLTRCAHLIANDRNIRILYTTNTRDNAIQFSIDLQEALTHNEKLVDTYGVFAPASGDSGDDASGAWRQDFFTVAGRTGHAREPTFTASSVGRTKVGMHYDCVLPGTLVMTSRGYKAVEDVHVGDRVLTMTGKYEFVDATAQKLSDKAIVGIRPYYQADATYMTEDHLVYVIRGRRRRWIAAGKVRETDGLVFPIRGFVNRFRYAAIKDITTSASGGSQLVHDIQVRNSHSFCVPGMVLHNCLIYDDCVDGENSLTADALIKLRKWFILSNSLVDQSSTYGPGGCILVNGTRYSDGDLYGWLLGEVDAENSPCHRYTHLVLRAMENPECWVPQEKRFVGAKLNFSFVLTEEKLAIQRELGPFHFYTQYQNECVAPDDAHFRAEWFTIVKPYDVPRELRYYVFTDFAFGLDDSNDRTALWVVGLDWERKAYCCDFEVGRWSLNERCTRVCLLAQKYDAQKVALEQVNSNEGVKSTLLRMRDEMRIRFKLEEIGGRSQESKMLRIVSMQPRFEQRRIFFVERDANDWTGIKAQYISLNKDGVPTGEIVQEFVRFPRATHDDIPDALSDIDKISQTTKTYYFPGASARSSEKTLGPTVMNGTVLYRMGVPDNGKANAQGKSQEGDFYAKHAARLRSRTATRTTRK